MTTVAVVIIATATTFVVACDCNDADVDTASTMAVIAICAAVFFNWFLESSVVAAVTVVVSGCAVYVTATLPTVATFVAGFVTSTVVFLIVVNTTS